MKDRDYLIYGTYRLPKRYKTFKQIILRNRIRGIEWIDTAHFYNKGKSERWIGRIKTELGNKFKLRIATKAGKFLDENNNLIISLDEEVIFNHINASLNRLAIDKLDALFLHNYDNKSSFQEISNLIRKILVTKKVDRIGLSNFPMDIAIKLIENELIDLIQIEHNELNNNKEYILECQKRLIECWVYRPFLKGKLIKMGRGPQEIISSIHKHFPNVKIVFGATKLSQITY